MKRLFLRRCELRLFSILVGMTVVLALPGAASPPPDVQNLASAIDNHYNHLHTLIADFTESYTGVGTERTESGTLWLKKPGKMRWEYRSPREKLFISDGKQAWFFIPGEQQVRKVPINNLEDLRSPLAFLLGKTRLQKELKGLRFAADIQTIASNDVVLEGNPTSMADRIDKVVLEITPEDRIARIILNASDGSTTEFRFSNQQEDVRIPDQQFHFTPPPGVQVIAGDLAQ